MQRQIATRCGALVCAALVTLAAALASASISRGDLSSREQSLQQGISSDNGRIGSYQGRLSDLERRLAGIESSLDTQRTLLARIQDQFLSAQNRLGLLRHDLVRDRRVLAAQLVAEYESPSPDLVGVVLESQGFSELLDHVRQMRLVAERNARVVRLVDRIKSQVAAQTKQLAAEQARQQRVTAAVLIERDQVASLHLAVLQREQVAARDRAHKQAELRQVQHQLAALQARANAAQTASFANNVVYGGSSSGGGEWGFFPAPGTNYTYGEEPEIAARLNTLGKALHLHLIGLSGYRSPQHSVEVGGFADDPHTRGEASDTPGVEGVPEATLLKFGLTRPFPGPAEADHIQLA